VLGTGIWVGVQHLGYLEFGELRRVAQRTIEQRRIMINNLAIRRAVEELKVAQTGDQLASILIAAFGGNDFDALDLHFDVASPDFSLKCGFQLMSDENRQPFVRWTKLRSRFEEMATSWSLCLDLVSSNHCRIGAMKIHRLYNTKDLQFDINLLISVFPAALADAVLRVSVSQTHLLPNLNSVPAAMAAGLGD
jgi:UDP-GlcNAc:undecaprenyl-phosphate GlcNAc-1-phosphate transferase